MDHTTMTHTPTVPDAVSVQRIAQSLADLQDTANTVGLHIGLGIHGLPVDLLTEMAATDGVPLTRFPPTDDRHGFYTLPCYRRGCHGGRREIRLYAVAEPVEESA